MLSDLVDDDILYQVKSWEKDIMTILCWFQVMMQLNRYGTLFEGISVLQRLQRPYEMKPCLNDGCFINILVDNNIDSVASILTRGSEDWNKPTHVFLLSLDTIIRYLWPQEKHCQSASKMNSGKPAMQIQNKYVYMSNTNLDVNRVKY